MMDADERTLPERLRKEAMIFRPGSPPQRLMIEAADALEAAEQPRIAKSLDELAATMTVATERLRREYGLLALSRDAEALRRLGVARDDCRQAEDRVAELEAEAARAVVFEPGWVECAGGDTAQAEPINPPYVDRGAFVVDPAALGRAVADAFAEHMAPPRPYRPTADEMEAAWAVMHDGQQMNGGAYRLTEDALVAAHAARTAELGRR